MQDNHLPLPVPVPVPPGLNYNAIFYTLITTIGGVITSIVVLISRRLDTEIKHNTKFKEETKEFIKFQTELTENNARLLEFAQVENDKKLDQSQRKMEKQIADLEKKLAEATKKDD